MKFESKTLADQPYLYVERTCEYADMAQTMGEAFGTVFAATKTQGITPQSQPMSVYTAMPGESGVTFRGAVMISAEDAAKASGDVQVGTLPAGNAMHTVHTGAYSGLGNTHKQLWSHIKENGLTGTMPVWEVYLDDPGATPEGELRTAIYCALR